MSRLSYEVVDVFTDRPFAGNQLAVVFDADTLETVQMQAIAQEFNFSETAFPLSPTDPTATYRLRIFTPAVELPFAGHPSVGSAVVQRNRGLIKAGDVVQECGAGLMPIHVTDAGTATLTGGPPSLGAGVAAGPLLEGLGLVAGDLVGPPPAVAGCGLDWEYVFVRDPVMAGASAPRHGQVNVFSWDPSTRTAHSRVFAPDAGAGEDPATGSAALGLGVYLVSIGLLPGEGTSEFTIRQGAELGRPSRLDCTVTASGGAATRATVTGQVVAIASGEIEVPPV
jgi:trans-2,3-dihydro-3-hydroxyanthranilate isomerase